MQFTLVVTEKSGMGISWDEEQPPVYEDVPNSPPGYPRMEESRERRAVKVDAIDAKENKDNVGFAIEKLRPVELGKRRRNMEFEI
jgi:hypothetical protein